MKVLRLYGAGDLRLDDDISPAQPGQDEELVRVTAVGICGSDLHWYGESGIGDAVLTRPVVLGHEAGGVIVEGREPGRWWPSIRQFRVSRASSAWPAIRTSACGSNSPVTAPRMVCCASSRRGHPARSSRCRTLLTTQTRPCSSRSAWRCTRYVWRDSPGRYGRGLRLWPDRALPDPARAGLGSDHDRGHGPTAASSGGGA